MTTSTFLEIDIGLAPNDGTGDPIRDAFDKVNKNFSTIFTSTSLVMVSGLKLTDLADTPKDYSLTLPPVNGIVVLTNDNVGTYTNKYFYGSNDITVTQTGSNVVIAHLYTATTASIASTLVLRDSSGNIPGALGYTGSQGSGFTGSSGAIGPIGPIGYTGSAGGGGGGGGPIGPIGPIGYDGSMGLIGYTGSAGGGGGGGGPIGPIGPIGYDGSIGYTGSLGYTGSSAGFTGSVGFTGSIGGPTVYISLSPPGSPVTGDFWAVPL